MGYKEKASREQIMLLPDSIEEYVDEDNPVRVIDAFVDSLDLVALNFTKSKPAATGCPAYDPSDLLKLYVYGYYNRIRSSRKLMTECGRNVEVMWLMGKLTPDFRTISDFRKENAKSLKLVFKEFVKLCDKLKLFNKELLAVDGTKIRAQNSDDKCFNVEILQKKLANIEEHIAEYLRAMDKTDDSAWDETMTPEQVRAALKELSERKEKYEGYLSGLEETGATQKLLTDPEAHRMHSTNSGFHCCYNVQTAVDSGSHLIAEYEVTDNNTDQGLLNQVCTQAKETLGVATIEAVADKGYDSREDIYNCLMNGTVPNVGLKYDKDERVYNLDYIEAGNTEKLRASVKPEDIEKCLHAGVLPECYEDTAVSVEVQELSTISCFARNDDGTVICPMGQVLSKLKVKGNNTIYGSREACRQCNNRCTSSSNFKTVSFGPNTDCIPVKMYGGTCKLQPIPNNARISSYNHTLDRSDYAAKKKVVIRIRADREKLKERMCLSEHPFGTVKWYHGAHYFLCRGKEKVSGEMGLSFLAYNIRRAITLVGVPKLIAAAREGTKKDISLFILRIMVRKSELSEMKGFC
jgi:transposase